MKVTIQNQDYYISFPEATNHVVAPMSVTRSILCNVRKVDQKDKVVASALSYTHKNDRYIRVVGEKKALERALIILEWNKEDRTTVWNAYLASSKKRRRLVGNRLQVEQAQTV